MNRTVHSIMHRPISTFAQQLIDKTEKPMARITYDGLLLQAHIAPGTTMTLVQIATDLFMVEEDREPSKVAMCRARRAALNLVTMGQATAHPSRHDMTRIRSVAPQGTQLSALMNLGVRQAITHRLEDEDAAADLSYPDVAIETQVVAPATP
jgi:hypothetical protein